MTDRELLAKYRRPGVNVGDLVRLKERWVEQYNQVWPGLTKDQALPVVFRHQIVGGARTYWCHLQFGDRTVLAKPSHLKVAKKCPGLLERPR